ncbi:TPA: hypothetical protein EYN98_11045 [Candidatus Poribacteria bacterium]|nr:hypothetical protein [Candidatus Poribacteria bacterium]HIO48678.1 hypothetical protein [Candidatus Poribacteria bacterium]
MIEQTGCVPILLAPQKINYLVAERSRRSASIGEFSPQSVYHCKRFWLIGWTSPVEFIEWQVEAPTAGHYQITVLAEAKEGTEILVQSRLEHITFRFADSGKQWGSCLSPQVPVPSAWNWLIRPTLPSNRWSCSI